LQFEVQIIGSNSAVAEHGRYPTSQVVSIHDKVYLVDCGEGTQLRLKHFKVKRSRIQRIFISHLHGDHYFGLIGLLTTFHLLQRTSPLTIYGPVDLQRVIELQLSLGSTNLHYPLHFVATDPDKFQLVFEDEDVQVFSLPLIHRINTTGFVFKEKVLPRKINKSAVEGMQLTPENYQDLREGKDICSADGQHHQNARLTLSGHVPRSYAFISDTLFHPELSAIISGADLLYHEATFMNEHAGRAKETFHSTSKQAAEMAKLAGVKKLLLGHFSSKYHDLEPLLEEARSVFPASYIAREGEIFQV